MIPSLYFMNGEFLSIDTINHIADLEQEIKRLNGIIEIKTNRIQDLMKRLSKRTERIDKAIEYIETHQLNFKKGTTTFGSERLSMEERKLLDILRGVDKE